MSHFADGLLTLWNALTTFTILRANEWNAYEAELNLLEAVVHLGLYRWPENIKPLSNTLGLNEIP